MEILKAIILGIIQGFTEFLPVSSSGHLAIAGIFGYRETDHLLALFVILHLGTLGAVILGMKKEIKGVFTDRKDLILPLAASTFATGILGLLLKKIIEKSLHSAIMIAAGFIITAVLLTAGEYLFKRSDKRNDRISVRKGLFIGIFQGIAVFPGISRSGSTIAAGLFMGLSKKTAVTYSFLMSLLSIPAALILEIQDVINLDSFAAPAAGFVAAFISGYAALRLMFRIIGSRLYLLFGLYTFILGNGIFLYEMIRNNGH